MGNKFRRKTKHKIPRYKNRGFVNKVLNKKFLHKRFKASENEEADTHGYWS